MALIAVDSGHVGAVYAVVLEVFVEWFDTHGADALGNQIADWIVGHGTGDGCFHAKAIG